MPYLLNLGYFVLLLFALPWLLLSALTKGKYREGYAEKFLGSAPLREGGGHCVWVHAVSVGEVNLVATLIAALRLRHPDWTFVVSTTTKTGYQLALRRYSDLDVFYCPLDFSWAVRRAMRRVRPSLLLLAELELWPNLIRAAKSHGAQVAVVNGRLSERSFRGYCRLRPLIGRMLRQLDLVAAQNPTYAERFRALGASDKCVHVTGSLKFDGAETDRQNPATQMLRRLAGIATDDRVLLAGSTQEPEEALALAAYQQLAEDHPSLRLILVPRHPERFDAVAEMLGRAGVRYQRRSELNDEADRSARVLLVDAIGELGAWWGTAAVAFVGGSLGRRGGQNMIEPAAYGAAVSFGPNTANFRDIVAALLAADGAVVVEDGCALTTFVRRCLEEPGFAARLGANAQALVRSQLGATERTAELVARLIATPPAQARRNAA